MSLSPNREDLLRIEALRLAVQGGTSASGILINAEQYYKWLLNNPKSEKSTRKDSLK